MSATRYNVEIMDITVGDIERSSRPITTVVKKEMDWARNLYVEVELAPDCERMVEDEEAYKLESDFGSRSGNYA